MYRHNPLPQELINNYASKSKSAQKIIIFSCNKIKRRVSLSQKFDNINIKFALQKINIHKIQSKQLPKMLTPNKKQNKSIISTIDKNPQKNSFYNFKTQQFIKQQNKYQINEKQRFTNKSWQIYQGQILQGKFNGLGILHFQNGNKFSGFFKDNLAQGQGTYYYKNKFGKVEQIVHGIWQKGQMLIKI